MALPFQEQVNLDGALTAGAVIGKAGCNVKWLRAASGGAILDVQDTSVVVKGRTRDVVDRCVRLLRAQLEANARLASPVYPHPLRVDYVLLQQAFGGNPRLRFLYRDSSTDEAARAASRKEPLFVLAPSDYTSSGSGGSGFEVDQLAGLFMASASLRPRDASSVRSGQQQPATQNDCFHAETADALDGAVAAALSASAKMAAGNSPGFDVLKLRFNLGKQFFFNLGEMSNRRNLILDDLHDFERRSATSRYVFSNCVPAATVPRVTAWLTGPCGFTLVDTKVSGTVHINDEALNVHYAIALTLPRSGGPGADLRKVKSSSTKCHFVVLLAGPEQLDLRLKLLGQRRDMQDNTASAVADSLVAACRSRGYEAVSRAGFSGALPRGMVLDVARKKIKDVYEARIKTPSGEGLLVKMSVVTVESKDGARTEITGSVPSLDQQLAELLPAGSSACPSPSTTTPVSASAATSRTAWALGEALTALTVFLSTLGDYLKQPTEVPGRVGASLSTPCTLRKA